MKKTFDYQDALQTFPIPPMKSTHSKLLEWIQPLVDEQQFNHTTKITNDFFKEHGDGEKLQQKLHELKEQTDGSWLTPFWNDHYLKYRGSLPTGMHFNILVNQPPIEKQLTTAELAGRASFSVAEYYHKIIDGDIEPVFLKGVPLDMEQYKKFFRSIRIPQVGKDEFKVANFDKRNNFIVLIYQNNMYRVPVTDEVGNIYQSEQLTTAIDYIFQSHEKEEINIGLFTTAEREEAAQIYNDLKVDPVNANNFEAIANALIVISIDEESQNPEEAVEGLMLNSRSKYFDKTIQLVITKKGRIGYSIEHTAVDGTTIFAVISYINDGLAKKPKEVSQTVGMPITERLKWTVSEDIEASLNRLEEESVARKKTFHIESTALHSIGAETIKKLRISPDAFFHMALQIAQYRTFGTFKSVYEPVSIRHFKEGRTECARATSMEKVAVVEAIESKQSNEDIYAKMEQASAAHAKRIADSRSGLGIERHMFGLEQVYVTYGKQLGIEDYPEIFKDPGYKALRTDFLSTSGMAYDNVHSRVFAPVVKGGFGVAYILLDKSISLNLSCRISEKTQSIKLSEQLEKALWELKEIAESVVYTKK